MSGRHKRYSPPCHNQGGRFCAANKKGLCIALDDATFENDICPFFRDRAKMQPWEKLEYDRIANNVKAKGAT